ncbi:MULTISPECIES: patatin-like phospholipase family protein [Cysteiniphilum]|uniref:patatin-like phospholipase family protein n=1 Tax=Cysteiniphilum TaxID=2056696 RepID=UPI00178074B5|nr:MULTISPECIES: patatin-like phospholipase family protein [Cysteiniphilum]
MAAPETVNILNLHGGGIRGYLSATFLKRFCIEAGINANQLYNTFDIISGTSIGGIQALGYAYGKSPQYMLDLFDTYGANIFGYGTFAPHVVSRDQYMGAVLMGIELGGLISGYDYTYNGITLKSMYQNTTLQSELENAVGSTTLLSDLPGKVIITSYDVDESKPVLFSNITGHEPFLMGASEKAVDVGLATSAAPIYFPIHTFGGHSYTDGGVFQNNPVETAFSVAKRLYPNARRFNILSVGTGVKPEGFTTDVGSYASYNVQLMQYALSKIFIPGPQRAASDQIAFDSSYPYFDINLYQFNYTFGAGEDDAMDNPDASNLANLSTYANNQYDTDAVDIANFITHLNAV